MNGHDGSVALQTHGGWTRSSRPRARYLWILVSGVRLVPALVRAADDDRDVLVGEMHRLRQARPDA